MTERPVGYSFGVLRVVPHPHVGAFANVGVILHSPAGSFIGMRVLDDPVQLRALVPDVDVELLLRYLASSEAVCRGDESGGPIALLAPSERFHWLTAPRSDVLQCSPVHTGIARDLPAELERLFHSYVGAVAPHPGS